ncbi:uncharacterized protein LOC109860411 [Pseudomyrmex gracilis]|uniref:uncharacterized protein LOC109860411 n=1 Tax=Pseudomyrmex gracilis TaxID=219809 RepID=UPI00099497DC|nr:uncharacterized protein LOC109860411 [Pseudomyrmex gracilis]
MLDYFWSNEFTGRCIVGYRNFPRIYTDETTAQEEKSWQKTCFYCYGRKAFLLHMKIIEFLYNRNTRIGKRRSFLLPNGGFPQKKTIWRLQPLFTCISRTKAKCYLLGSEMPVLRRLQQNVERTYKV